MNKAAYALCTLLLAAGVGVAQEAAGDQFALHGPPPAPGYPGEAPRPPGFQYGQIPPPANRDPVGENLFPPELIMAHQKAIGLDDAQKTYIRSELLKTQTRFTELQWQLQDAMESLASLLKEDRVDEQQALAQLDKVLNTEREVKRLQISLALRLKNKLTTEQQAKLKQLRGELPPGAAGPQ